MTDRFVYFIKPVGLSGPIKIGCSDYPALRLKTLMSWSPFELEIIATTPGGFDLERNLHECFFDLHQKGEWFVAGKRLLETIAALNDGAPIEAAVDLTDRKGGIRKGQRRTLSENTKLRMRYAQRINGQLRSWRKKTGKQLREPDHVDEIMGRWRGHWKDPEGTGIPPSPDQLKMVDDFLANLPASAVLWEVGA